MSDPFSTAATLALTTVNQELALQIEELRAQLPQKPLMRVSRMQFDQMTPADRMALIKRGGTVHDDGYAGIVKQKVF
jgi:hypothetical protein